MFKWNISESMTEDGHLAMIKNLVKLPSPLKPHVLGNFSQLVRNWCLVHT